MKHLIRLSDYSLHDVQQVFDIADRLNAGAYQGALQGKTIVMFFPESSIRTRITFEKGVFLLGGQTVLFPPAALDKPEKTEDVIGYLNNWADGVVVRHKSIALLDEMREYARFPVINAMTDVNHPCEILSDLYALSKMRPDFTKDRFLFVGARGNIGLAWKEAAELFGFSLTQCCPPGYEIPGVDAVYDLPTAIAGKTIICTDSLTPEQQKDFFGHQLTLAMMELASKDAVLNPCPPFYRGKEVSEEAIRSPYFVGYEFKKHLLAIEQAVLLYGFME